MNPLPASSRTIARCPFQVGSWSLSSSCKDLMRAVLRSDLQICTHFPRGQCPSPSQRMGKPSREEGRALCPGGLHSASPVSPLLVQSCTHHTSGCGGEGGRGSSEPPEHVSHRREGGPRAGSHYRAAGCVSRYTEPLLSFSEPALRCWKCE